MAHSELPEEKRLPRSPAEEASFDPQGLAQQFGSTRRLVAELLGAESKGGDAEQDVILAALQRPPTIEKGLTAWFAGAVRKRRLHLRRTHVQREGRELRAVEAHPRPPVDEPHAAVQRAETQERLTAAVMALPEPYRTPVVQRFLEEYDTGRSQLSWDRPLSTIQTQLRRGLALLRERLNDEDRRDGGDWSTALAALLIPHPGAIRRKVERVARGARAGRAGGWLRP